MTRIRVLVMAHQQLLCDGIVSLLMREPDLEVVAQSNDGVEGVGHIARLQPNVAIVDLLQRGLNGVDAARRIGVVSPATHVLCLSTGTQAQLIKAALDAGVRGIICTHSGIDELLSAIRALMRRQLYLSPILAECALSFSGVLSDGHHNLIDHNSAFHRLTPKEREVVQLLAEGHSTKQAAARLSVSFKTVATHREHAMSKLGLRGLADLTRYAIREGLTGL